MTTLAAARRFAQDFADSTGKAHIIWRSRNGDRYFVLEIGKKPVINNCEQSERFIPTQKENKVCLL